nr:MAG TPA: Protein of unknown function (DUF2535) [Caudoviricetes sp.]
MVTVGTVILGNYSFTEYLKRCHSCISLYKSLI